jgi:hypothetical protein
MVMGNEPVNPNKQSNDKQNEDTIAKLLALAALAGLAWWARKRTQASQVAESQKIDPIAQHAESQKIDPIAQHYENMRTLAEIRRIQDINTETGRHSW